MADAPTSSGRDVPRRFPRVPAHAWRWLQRSRPVVTEAALRLTGGPPPPGFVEELREAFDADAFTRDVVVGVVADIAFNGRVPTHRPAGVSWDRGLTWWAAALAGATPAEFEAPAEPPQATQRALFDPAPAVAGAASSSAIRQAARARVRADGPRSSERAALALALRELLASAGGDQVPASAIRQLVDQLERDG